MQYEYEIVLFNSINYKHPIKPFASKRVHNNNINMQNIFSHKEWIICDYQHSVFHERYSNYDKLYW